jgi:hypothetical protein
MGISLGVPIDKWLNRVVVVDQLMRDVGPVAGKISALGRTESASQSVHKKSPSKDGNEAAMASYDEVMAAVAEGFEAGLLPGARARHPGSPEGGSLLLTALYRGRQDLVNVLAPRVQMDVFEAAALGDTARVRDLVKKSPQLLRQHSSDGWTALHLAAFMGHHKTVEALLELGADVSALSKNQMANQPPHAALAGKTDRGVVETLIARSADVNGRGGGGVRPLHLAASRGDLSICELLIGQGADVAAKMDDGMTADAIAGKRGHAAVAEQLRTHLR